MESKYNKLTRQYQIVMDVAQDPEGQVELLGEGGGLLSRAAAGAGGGQRYNDSSSASMSTTATAGRGGRGGRGGGTGLGGRFASLATQETLERKMFSLTQRHARMEQQLMKLVQLLELHQPENFRSELSQARDTLVHLKLRMDETEKVQLIEERKVGAWEGGEGRTTD